MKKETKYKKALINLSSQVIMFENKMEIIMKLPSNEERGKKIASALNELTIENQKILHFDLGYSFKKINKLYSIDNGITVI